MGQLNILQQNGQLRSNGSKSRSSFRPTLVKSSEEQAAVYAAALQLIEHIDENLATGRCHYRTKSGKLLRTLDEVVRAILADNLMLESDAAVWQQDLARAA